MAGLGSSHFGFEILEERGVVVNDWKGGCLMSLGFLADHEWGLKRRVDWSGVE